MIETKLRAFIADLVAGNVEAAAARVAPVWLDGGERPGQPTPVELWRDLGGDLVRAFSERAIELSDVKESGDALTAKFTFSGKQSGALWGYPACGKSMSLGGNVTARLVGDKLVVGLAGVSAKETLVAIGVLPPFELLDRPLVYPVSLPDAVLKLLFNGGFFEKPCSHLDQIRVTEPASRGCPVCDPAGIEYPTTRMCLTCGHVGCCDTSKQKHARKHFEATGHPLMRSLRFEETWMWCYVDNTVMSKRW